MSLQLDINPLREGLTRERVVDPCIFVVFGGTGDLAHKNCLMEMSVWYVPWKNPDMPFP